MKTDVPVVLFLKISYYRSVHLLLGRGSPYDSFIGFIKKLSQTWVKINTQHLNTFIYKQNSINNETAAEK